MDNQVTTATSGKGAGMASSSSTSSRKASLKRELKDIPLEVRLQLIQQTVYDYKEAGGEVTFIEYELPEEEGGGVRTAIVLMDVRKINGHLKLHGTPTVLHGTY